MVGLFFRNDFIYMASLINCDVNFDETHEIERKALHDSTLSVNGITPEKEYDWGKVESDYDKRSNLSSINVYYSVL